MRDTSNCQLGRNTPRRQQQQLRKKQWLWEEYWTIHATHTGDREIEFRTMASNPGLFTEWPWKRLGNFKYVLLAPLLVHTVYSSITRKEKGVHLDKFNLCIIPIQVLRVIHTQFWISLSRFQTARSTKNRIVSKSLEFEQVDRERNWDDQIVLTTLILYIVNVIIPVTDRMPWWDTRGILLTIFLHTGPVEFLYYWFHRALHHHFLYSRYHSHHHSSIVTEPITAVIHPFAEEVVYFMLFAIPLLTIIFTETGSIAAFCGYLMYIDFMNYLGHCNFEIVPNWMFQAFPPLKYLMYTPSFHSLHHTQFRTNYSLFMPFYDHVYGTVDKSTDDLYKHHSLKAKGCMETPHVVHLTHPTSLLSIYHLRVGFASLASRPYGSVVSYAWLMWPLSGLSLMLTWICGSAFAVEKISMGKLEMQTWVIPRYGFQYLMSREGPTINEMIERAISDAEENGIRVLSLGLMNQDEELNKNGELYVVKNPRLKVRISDGSCLAVAGVLNSIPQGTKQVIMRGKLSKVAFVVAKTLLCQRSIQIITIRRTDYETLKLQLQLPANIITNKLLILSSSGRDQLASAKVWLVGDGVSAEEQSRAVKGTTFIPFSQFPPREHRGGDCVYHATPSMIIPKSLENIHCCENWLPRRVMSAWRVAGIVHALEGWNVDEVGDMVVDHEKAWKAALSHGFLPFTTGFIV